MSIKVSEESSQDNGKMRRLDPTIASEKSSLNKKESRGRSDKRSKCISDSVTISKESSQNIKSMRRSNSESPCLTDPTKIPKENSQLIKKSMTKISKENSQLIKKSMRKSDNKAPSLTETIKVSEESSQNKNHQDISETINKTNQTPPKLDSNSNKISPTYIVVKVIGSPIVISEVNLRIAKKATCDNNEKIIKL